jgi:thiamine-monophosphate kinase
MTASGRLGPGKEFDAVRELLEGWGDRAAHAGDDAAVVDFPANQRMVVSTDVSNENVHFRREWLSPEEIGWRATVAALSDLAAMAAKPIGLVSAMTVPASWRDVLGGIGEGIGKASSAFECPILGGDLSSGTELSIAVTVIGSTSNAIMRKGARAGDVLWVTGMLGAPGEAVRAWNGGKPPLPRARARFAHPMARIREARWLADNGCTAAIDISDGLVADARHIAAASAMTLTVVLDAIPCFDDVTPRDAAASGEEYELLVAGPINLNVEDFAREFGITLTRVGEVSTGPPHVTVIHGGKRVEFGGGYDHFSR